MVRVANAPPRPLLIYDGDCDFCRAWIDRWREETGDRVDYEPYQAAAGRFPEIPPENFRRAVHLVEPDGTVRSAAAAVFAALAASGRLGALPQWVYRHVPGAAFLSEAAYRFVAGHRGASLRVTCWVWGESPRRPTFHVSRDLFLRGLGLVHLVAFLSLLPQLAGLAGHAGILPARDYLDAVHRARGAAGYWLAPTLCWLNAGDGMLHLLAGGGVAVSLLLVAGVAPAACLLVLWALYLSLTSACGDFLGFQWDSLLLETTLFAVFAAPFRLRNRFPMRAAPHPLALPALSWLLFRLMLSSGVVKLTSGDPSWLHLTALRFHYETQCLPTPVAWYAQQLPAWFHRLSLLVMFGVELVLPFFIFLPRRPRLVALGGFVLLQVAIALTGNYGFFNVLTLVLCVLLVDDAVWPLGLVRRAGVEGPATASAGEAPRPVARPPRSPGLTQAAASAALVLLLVTSLVPLGRAFRKPIPWPGPLVGLASLAESFRSVNGYGLFAVMTTERDEIVIEGSVDGETWLPYEFRWKPGDVRRPPAFVAPHMPRLDWQMWFLPFGGYRENPWFGRFLRRLLEGSPAVTGLLAVNPFPEAPPRYLRAVVYVYRFTSFEERRKTGAWWAREAKGLYAPILTRS